ncbi:MAG: hypothetical protein ACOY3Y_03680 [Acidobacteriota bacterium]
MLPATFTDFNAPLWTTVEALNDNVEPHAELLLKPYTWDDRCELLAEFGICTRCAGDGEITDIQQVNGERRPVRVKCTACGGKVVDATANPALRRRTIERLVHGWRNIRARHPLTGAVTEPEYTAEAALGLSAVMPLFLAVVAKAMSLAALQDTEKKDSTTPLSGASPAAETAVGNEG